MPLRVKKPYRQIALGYQQGYPVDYLDLVKRKLPSDGADGWSTSGSNVYDSHAANSSTINNSIYNPVLSSAALNITGGMMGSFGTGDDGDYNITVDTTYALQDRVVIKNYDNMTLNGKTLHIPSGQGIAIIFVKNTLDFGDGGAIVHDGNPYQINGRTSTSMKGLHTDIAGDPSREGGDGGAPGGSLFIFARTITGSGTVSADGLDGDAGDSGISGTTGVGVAGTVPTTNLSRVFTRETNVGWSGGSTASGATGAGGKTGGTGGVAQTTIGSAPRYDYYEAWYKNANVMLRLLTEPGLSLSTSDYETDGPPCIIGRGGDSGSAGAKSDSKTGGGTSAGGGAGGAGGSLLRGILGGNGGDGGDGGGWTYWGAPFINWAEGQGGGGGGGGGAGGVVGVICAVNSATLLTISANGGAGGAGGAGTATGSGAAEEGGDSAGGAGGGGGGAGGIALYQGPSNAGVGITANGGAAGTGGGGDKTAGMSDPEAGDNGVAGGEGLVFNGSYNSSITLSPAGTSYSPTFTAGRIPFAGSDGILTEDSLLYFNSTSNVLYTGTANLSALTPNRLVISNGSSNLESVADLTAWLAGTTNQVTVTDDGDGSVTLSLPQDIDTAATPTFGSLTLSGLTATRVLFAGAGGLISDDSGFTFTAASDSIALAGFLNVGTTTDATTAGDMAIGLSASNRLFFDQSAGSLTLTGTHLLFSTDNSVDIGASGATRPRTVYAGTSFIAPASGVGYAFASATTTGLSWGGSTLGLKVGGTLLAAVTSSGFVIEQTSGSFGALLVADAANVLAMKNSGNSQTIRVYGTITGPKYLILTHNGTDGLIDTADATNGLKIAAAATQKVGLWGVTPVVQPSSTGEGAGYTGGGGTALTHTDTFTGNSGTKAYTINDIVKHLKAAGILAGS